MLPDKNEEEKDAHAADSPLQDVDRLIEKVIPPYIITLGLCESTLWKVREEEYKKTRTRFWKRQITVFALYLPCALGLTFLLMHYSKKGIKEREMARESTITQILTYYPTIRTNGPGGGGGGSTGRDKKPPTKGSLPEIKERKNLILNDAKPRETPVPEKIETKVVEGKIPAIPIMDEPNLPIGDSSGDISAIPSFGEGGILNGIGSGHGNGIGSGTGPGIGPGSGGGTGGGEGGGIGRGIGAGVTLAEAELISRPKPPRDTAKRPLNRLLAFHKGEKISFAALCTSQGNIERTELVRGIGDTFFEELFLQYVRDSWKFYAAISDADAETLRKFQATFHPEREHYHIRDWILFNYTIR